MKARPIIFSTPMIKALLNGRKSQTRRVIKGSTEYIDAHKNHHGWKEICPYGKVGDLLWVKETFLFRSNGEAVVYKADMPTYEAVGFGALYGGWKPSIYMPRWASRLTLEITDIRVKRLQDMLLRDYEAEGIVGNNESISVDEACTRFTNLWESINGKGSWDVNSWVWVIEFKAHKCNVDKFIQNAGR